MSDKLNIWTSLIRAAEAEPREPIPLRGVSGIEHPTLAVGVDDRRGRLIVVSADHDGRSAAMMQADVQAAFGTAAQVIVARPVVLNLPGIAQTIIDFVGSSTLTMEQLGEILQTEDQKYLKEGTQKILSPFFPKIPVTKGAIPLNIASQFMQLVQQLALVDFNVGQPAEKSAEADLSTVGLEKLAKTDPGELDRSLGVCPIPLYEFTEKEMESLVEGQNIEEIKMTLQDRGILQYFFPAPDQTALGLIGRGLTNPETLGPPIKEAPALGHPYGPAEIASVPAEALEIVEALQHEGLIVEGEFGFDLTDKGTAKRATVRFRPREGVISKLINRVSVKFNLTDLF